MNDDDKTTYRESLVEKDATFCMLCGGSVEVCADCDIDFKPSDRIYCGDDGTHICNACFEDRLWI